MKHPSLQDPGSGSRLADHWSLDPTIAFLNHGAFGACPRAVLDVQQRFRQQLEQEPLRFFRSEYEPLLDTARHALAEFVGADAADLVFVPNATTGANCVLRSLYDCDNPALAFGPEDELLTTNHAYNACRNALEFVAQRSGAKVVVATIPFPLASVDQVIEAVLACISPRTKLALLDHITSPTALILPIQTLVQELAARGIDTLVDGAHAPGMVPLDLQAIGAAYYTGNCHKWLCAPKGAGFLYVRPDRQEAIRPLTISHGANALRRDRTRFQLEFDWTGTQDPSPYLCVPAALQTLATFAPSGWTEIMAQNRAVALEARGILCTALDQPSPCPEDLIGAIAAIPLPDSFGPPVLTESGIDPVQTCLWEQFQIEVPIIPWFHPPRKLVRISAQRYNHIEQYRFLAQVLSNGNLGQFI
ncbi:MAG: aminotransferase class V-fold PLP-dependent enzyme [Thermosynechococcaceae cyanobacterium]